MITIVHSRPSTRQLGITIVHQCPSTSNKICAKTFNLQSVYLCKCLYNVHCSCHGFKLELLHNIFQFCFFVLKYFSKVAFKHLGYCSQCSYYNGNYGIPVFWVQHSQLVRQLIVDVLFISVSLCSICIKRNTDLNYRAGLFLVVPKNDIWSCVLDLNCCLYKFVPPDFMFLYLGNFRWSLSSWVLLTVSWLNLLFELAVDTLGNLVVSNRKVET